VNTSKSPRTLSDLVNFFLNVAKFLKNFEQQTHPTKSTRERINQPALQDIDDNTMEKHNRVEEWRDFALDPNRGNEMADKFLDAVSTFDRKAYGVFILAADSDGDAVKTEEVKTYGKWTDEKDEAWLKRMVFIYGKWPLPPGSAFRRFQWFRQGNCVKFRIRKFPHLADLEDEDAEKETIWINVPKTTPDTGDGGAWWEGGNALDMMEDEQTSQRIRGLRKIFYKNLKHRMECQYPRAMVWLLRAGWKGPEYSLDDDGRGLTEPIILQPRRKREGLGYVNGSESQNKDEEHHEDEEGEESRQKEAEPRQLQKFVHSESSDRRGKIYDATNEDCTILYFVDGNCNRLAECPRWFSSGELTRAVENNAERVFTPAEAERRAQWDNIRQYARTQIHTIQQGLMPHGPLSNRARRALERYKRFGPAQPPVPVPTPDTIPNPAPARARPPPNPTPNPARLPARPPPQAAQTIVPGPVQRARNTSGNPNAIARVENSGWIPPHMRGAEYAARVREEMREAGDDLADRMERAKIDDED
jgi:hypothetical protein